MRKFAAVFFAFFAIQAEASVLCEIITKDPRYNVASYIRRQSACVTTRQVGGIDAVKLGKIIIVYSALVYLTEKFKEANVEELITNDYKTVACRDTRLDQSQYTKLTPNDVSFYRGDTFEFLVGSKYALNKNTGKVFTKPWYEKDDAYNGGSFPGYRLNLNSMTLKGDGWEGPINMSCKIQEVVSTKNVAVESTQE